MTAVSDRRNTFPSILTTAFSKLASASFIEGQQARAVAAGTEAFGSLQELATASDTIAKVLAARVALYSQKCSSSLLQNASVSGDAATL